MIQWHEVTWYSRWGAILLFLVIVPTLCFYIGVQYELTQQSLAISPSVSTSTPSLLKSPQTDYSYRSKLIYIERVYHPEINDPGPFTADPEQQFLEIKSGSCEQPIDVTGWMLKSTVSGNSYTIGRVKQNSYSDSEVKLCTGDEGLIVWSGGSVSENKVQMSDTVMYMVFQGSTTTVWGNEHDTIQLVDKEGAVVDTFAY
jgi:hypothetical protein